MSKVTFDYSKACGFVQDHEMQYMSELAEQAKEKLLARTGARQIIFAFEIPMFGIPRL